ncbi:MAG: efflux transporter outer membrane subunit [Chlamydiales bacterium]
MRKFVIVALSVLLTGCFSANYCSKTLELAQTDLAQNIYESIAQQSVETVSGIPEKWWELFEDEQLNYLIELSLCCNPNIKVAQHRVNLAYEVAMQARSDLLPYIDAFGGYQRQKFSLYEFGVPALVPFLEGKNLFINLAQALLRGSFTLDVWGKNRALYCEQVNETEATRQDLEQAKLVLATSIASAYFNLQSHLVQLQILEQNTTDKRKVSALIKQRFYHGVTSEFFLYTEDRDVALLQDQVEEMKGIIATDKHTLAALVGNVASLCDTCIDIDIQIRAKYDCPFPLPESLPLNLLARRPDVRAQVYRIESARQDVVASKARFLPNIDLVGSIGPVSFLLTKFFTKEAVSWLGEAEAILPLYTGGQLCAKLGQSKEALEIAVQQYNRLVLKAVQEVSDALSNLTTADSRRGQIRRAVEDAKDLDRLTQEKFDHGIDTFVSVLNSRANVLVQQLTEAQIQLSRMQAMVDLIQSIGGGYCGRL